MQDKISSDVACIDIFPKLRTLDLMLLSEAFPNLASEAEHKAKSRLDGYTKLKSVKECSFMQETPPIVSPATASFIVRWDATDCDLQIRDTEFGDIIVQKNVERATEPLALQLSDDERHLFLHREGSVSVFELKKSIVDGKLSIDIDTPFHLFINNVHPYENYDPDRVELASSFILSGVTMDSTWTIVRVGYCFGPLKGNTATIKIDCVTHDVENTDPVDGYYNFDYQYFVDVDIPEDDIMKGVTRVMDPRNPDGPACTTVTLESVKYPKTTFAEVSFKPLRILFPPESARLDAVLVNPTSENGGPWAMTIPDTNVDDVLKVTLSPSREMVTVGTEEDDGFWIRRYRVSDGMLVQDVFVSLPENERAVAMAESRDDRICAVMYGLPAASAMILHGWVVVDMCEGGTITVESKQGEQSEELCVVVEKYKPLNKDVVMSEDGQIMSAVVRRGDEEYTQQLILFNTATGDVVNTFVGGARDDIPREDDWEWIPSPNGEPCVSFICKDDPSRFVMTRRGRNVRVFQVNEVDLSGC